MNAVNALLILPLPMVKEKVRSSGPVLQIGRIWESSRCSSRAAVLIT